MMISCSFRLILYLAVFSCTCLSNDYAFTSSGSLKHLEFFQQKVIANPEQAFSFALTYRNTTVLFAIRKHDPTLSEEESFIRKSAGNSNGPLLCSFVGWNPDCLATSRRCRELELEYLARFEETISPAQLALSLADDAQRRSMSGSERPWACNTLIIGCSYKGSMNGIYKVDVTGNFWKCQAAGIGGFAPEFEDWVSRRGVEIVASSTIEEEKREERKTEEGSSEEEEEFALGLGWTALCEVVGEALPNFCIEMAALQRREMRGPCRVFARRSRERGYVPQERPPESAETKEVARGDASKVEEGAADHGEGAEDDEGGSKGRALRRLLLSSSLDKKREGAAGQTALQVK